MKLSLPKYYNNCLSRAVAEFNLLEDGDRIVIGLSGGKDSSFLTYVLCILQQHLAIEFEVCVVTVDMGIFDTDEFNKMQRYCEILGLEYRVEKLETESPLTAKEELKSPCSVCSHVRKGALVNFMKREDYNKLALGHHLDDAVETFLLSIIYSGQITTFLPRQHLSRNDVDIIRPLVYLREKEINTFMNRIEGYDPVECCCRYSQEAVRARIKDKFRDVFRDKQLFSNLVAAIRNDAFLELWPERQDDEVITEKIKLLWGDHS